jgi:formylmethanofuran dehydrogenase subunit E
MTPGKHRFSPEDFNTRMNACGLSPKMKDYMNRVVKFHDSPAPGALIGVFMVDFALELLGVTPGEKLFAVCETPKCAPDALQVIANITTGNNRLRIIPIGKFAMTVNAATTNPTAESVRVYIDLEKLKRYPVIDMWYANSPEYNTSTMDIPLQEEIFRAGCGILSFERVRVNVTPKRKWKSVICPCCGDSKPDYLMESDRCGGCGSMKYYEKISG